MTTALELQDERAALPDVPPRPKIRVDVDESRVVDEAIKLFSQSRKVFQRGGRLVHIVRDAPPPKGIERRGTAPRIAKLPGPRLQELLSSRADWSCKTQ